MSDARGLTAAGIRAVCYAPASDSCWGKLEVFRPDVLLVDVKMPRLDGIGFFRQARERLPHVAAIFMTGLSEKELAGSGLDREPGVAFISKPVDIDELLALIPRVLGR